MILNFTLNSQNFLSEHHRRRSSMAESVSTRGGCSFDQLCEGGIATYCCDNLVDIRGLTELKHTKNKIVDKIKDIITSLEIGRGQRVAKIYIGKTYIQRRKKRKKNILKRTKSKRTTSKSQGRNLDPMDGKTWRVDGISDRWKDHRSKDYGKDGMVVLAAVTKEAIPPRCWDRIKKEDYAFAIEQRLLHHFLIATADQRVVNQGFCTGGTNKNKSAAYAIYMTFAFEETAQQELAMPASPISPEQDQSPTPPPPQTELYSLLEDEQVENTICLPCVTEANDTCLMQEQLQDAAGMLPPQNSFLPQSQTVGALSLPITDIYDTQQNKDDDSSDLELPPGWPVTTRLWQIGSHTHPIQVDSD